MSMPRPRHNVSLTCRAVFFGACALFMLAAGAGFDIWLWSRTTHIDLQSYLVVLGIMGFVSFVLLVAAIMFVSVIIEMFRRFWVRKPKPVAMPPEWREFYDHYGTKSHF